MKLTDVTALAADLMAEHGITEQGWTFAFDSAASRMGVCRYRDKRIAVSRLYAAEASHEDVRDTLLHEIAHVLAGARAKHGVLWKAHASRIGATPKACAARTPTPAASEPRRPAAQLPRSEASPPRPARHPRSA